MVTIYHNPRCSKSRQGVQYLTEKGVEFSIVKYLEDELSATDLKNLLQKLNMKPIDLVRTKESIWKNEFKGKQLSDDEIIHAMVENPRLIERPIVVNGNRAVVARPTEEIDQILD